MRTRYILNDIINFVKHSNLIRYSKCLYIGLVTTTHIGYSNNQKPPLQVAGLSLKLVVTIREITMVNIAAGTYSGDLNGGRKMSQQTLKKKKKLTLQLRSKDAIFFFIF